MLVFSYLGGVHGSHDLSKWIGVQKVKVEAIPHVPQSIDISQLWALMGLCNYYQKFVKGFNNITKPLT